MSAAIHKCAVSYCGIVIARGLLLCGSHWRRVSLTTNRELWRAWRACAGEPLKADEAIRSTYFNAVNRAIQEATARA